MLHKCQTEEEVMFLRKNEGTFPTLTPGAGASELGVSWVRLSRRDLSQGAQQRADTGLGIPVPLSTL